MPVVIAFGDQGAMVQRQKGKAVVGGKKGVKINAGALECEAFRNVPGPVSRAKGCAAADAFRARQGKIR